MESFDYQNQFETVKKDVIKAFTKALDIQALATKRKIEVKKVWIDDHRDTANWESQRDSVRKDKTWGVPVYAALDLIDRKSGKVLSSTKRVKVATLPKSTNLGSFIVEGKHYQVQSQFRRKPGIYVTERKNGQLKTEINIPGRAFDISFDPKTSAFKLARGPNDGSGLPLYPILSKLGVSDAALAKVWGKDILAANKKVSSKKGDEAVTKAAAYFPRSTHDSPDDAVKALREYLAETELRPEVTKETTGKEFKKASPEAIVAGSGELLKANRGDRAPDDRQALEYKKILSYSDLMHERLFQANGELASKLSSFRTRIYRRLNNKKSPPTEIGRLVSSNEFTPVFTTFFTSSSLSSSPDQTNPLNMLNGVSKATILGEGGVSDPMRVRSEEHGLHPSHLGFLDPIHTPDSANIGLVVNLPIGLKKRGENLQTRVIDPKTKKARYISPVDARKLVIAFPDQYVKGAFVNKKVKAIVNGHIEEVDPKKVDAVLASPKQAFSISSNTVPFLASTQGVRAQMATKMLEQAIPLTLREAPLVQVALGNGSIEDSIGDGFSVKAIADGVVEKVSPNRITIKTADGRVEQPIYNNIPLNRKAFLHASPRVKAGDEVKAGDVLADSNFTDKGTLALGTNLRAAYIPYKGYNFEDGIVISETAAKKLTSEHMHQFAVTSDEGTEFSRDKFLAWRPNELTVEQQDKLDSAGVIRKGQILKKGDPVWVGTKENRYDADYIAMRRLSPSISPKRGYKEEWTKDVDGEVVDVVKSGKKVKVYVKTREPAQIGDKLTNRYGGKGIITKIIPDGEAPHTEDGEPVDILLNPHGVVTRINPSQILETAAAKVAEKTGKRYMVDNFSGENHVGRVAADLAKAGIEDTEELYDPHSKKSLGKVLVGPQYILKLSKQATSQFSARSEGKYDANESPLQGGEDGAKALDMLAFYSMLAHGSRANLREMATYKASKNPEFWRWVAAGSRSGLVKPPPTPTFAYRKFEAYLKGAGVNVQRRGSKVVLGPMTDIETTNLSSGEVKDAVFKKAKNLEDERGGLTDPMIFGLEKNRWGHIELAEPMPNPIFEDPIKRLTGLKAAQYDSLVKGERFINPETGEWNDKEGLTGGKAVQHLLKKIDVDKELATWTDAAKRSKSSAKLDEANKRLKYLHALKKLGIRPEDAYVRTKLPVLPPQFRPIVELPDGTLSNPGLNTLYRDVELINKELEWQKDVPFLPEDARGKLRKDLYDGIKALSGLGSPIAFYPEKRRPKGIITQLKGEPAKKGFFQYNVLRRRQNLVGRGTIIPDPKLGVDEVGLPEEMSWSLYEKFVIRRLVNSTGKSPFDAAEEVRKRTPGARAALEAELASRPVLLNRAPSLHKFSVLAFKPRITDGKAVKIPPLVVKGFNADFDGDAMNVHVPVLPDAVREAERMLPSNNLYHPGTGRIMIRPQNEAALGLFMISRDPKARDQMLELLPDELKEKYATTTLTSNNLSALMKDLAEAMPRDHGKIVDKLKALGDEHTYRSGFTIGIKDLLPDIPEKEAIFAKTTRALGKINKKKVGGEELATEVVAAANKELDEAVNRRLGEQNNNLHLMVRSGARGNVNQLKQIVSAPFMINDYRGNASSIPIMKSFSEGLPFSDYWSTLYGARSVAVDKQLQTAQPGAFNKDIMASAVTNVVSGDDCKVDRGVLLSIKEQCADIEDRFLAKDIRSGGTVIARAGSLVTTGLLNTLRERKVPNVEVRSPLTCNMPEGTCSKCYGLDEHGQPPGIGSNIGAKSGQALSEPLTQMTMRTFHTGGIAGTRGIVSGYEKIDKLFKMHDIKRGRATLAMKDGKVEKVRAAAGKTGKNVWVAGKKHFVPQELWDPGKARLGSTLAKGDIMSFGIAQPQDLADLKGILPAQEYISDQVQKAYQEQGVPIKRRAIETVMRSVANTTKVLDPGDSAFIYGDVAPTTVVEHFNRQSLGMKSVEEAVGHALLEDVPGVRKGATVSTRVQKVLERLGKEEVEVGPRPIVHKPFLKGIERIPILRDDWMSQMGYRDIAKALIEGATKVKESDLHGFAPVPAFAYGAEFGDAPGGLSKTKGVY